MSYSSVSYIANGSLTNFTIPFSYLYTADLTVSVNNVVKTLGTDFTLTNAQTVHFLSAPANTAVVKVYRKTGITAPISDFSNGSTLEDVDLDLNANQAIYAIQDLSDNLQYVADLLPGNLSDTSRLLPTLLGGDTNVFVVGNALSWSKKTLAETKTLLGISDNPIPDPPGSGIAFLESEDGTMQWLGAADARTALGLSALATTDPADLGTAAYLDIGSGNNNVLAFNSSGVLDDATAAKVAFKGQLTLRAQYTTSYNTAGGNYPTALAWKAYTLTSLSTLLDPGTHTCALTSGQVVLDKGLWLVEGFTKGLWMGHARWKLVNTNGAGGEAIGSPLFTGSTDVDNDPVRAAPALPFSVLLNVTTTGWSYQLQIQAEHAQSDTNALGRPHGSAGLGDNVYANLTFTRIKTL